jgi:hypothetical protein
MDLDFKAFSEFHFSHVAFPKPSGINQEAIVSIGGVGVSGLSQRLLIQLNGGLFRGGDGHGDRAGSKDRF